MLRTSSASNTSARPRKREQVVGRDALRAELDPEAELARRAGGIGELGRRHRQQRCVVADLEQVDVEGAGLLERADEAQRVGDPVGVLPEERVGAEADHARTPSRAAASSAASSSTAASASGSCANRPRKSPSTASPSSASRPGPGRAAVDHRAVGAAVEGVDLRTEATRDLRDVRDRSGLGSPDRPDRLVRDDDAAGGRARRSRRAAGATTSAAASVASTRSGSPRQSTGVQAVAQRRRGLGRDDRLGLAEQPAPLGVADLGESHADLGELGARHLAGERARVVGRDILRPDARRACPRRPRAPAAPAGRWGSRSTRPRRMPRPDAAPPVRRPASNQRRASAMPEVHLQAHSDRHARGHQQLPVVSYSPMTATFSADAEAGSKR